ncbi:sulfotransferase family protein [Pseudomonas protegens]|uniref:sulfotransferase family protein n=1 Tax=Pseudomonas protegens TaxID=380021 RepID=UPI000641C8B4|nr:sulfotransferase family protein [Pseudomonas protegens]
MYPVDAKKNVVIVLGMHRSGTSAIAASLEQLGLVMGSSLFKGDEWNPKGYFEERQIVEFNDKLLALYDRRWDSPLPPIFERGPEWERCIDEAIALVQGLFGSTSAWGFKDPRTCLLAPFWGQVFSQMRIHPKLMMVVRDPTEVAHSLARRDGICADRTAWLWMSHLLGSLDYLDVAEDMRFFAFDHLLDQPAEFIADVADWLNLTPAPGTVAHFARDFIAPALSHGTNVPKTKLPALVVTAYACLRDALEKGVSPRAFRESAKWRSIISEYQCDIVPTLTSVQGFYKNDRQLTVMESRIIALNKGLEMAEKLALSRLGEMQKLDTQLLQTSDALARAEQIVQNLLDNVKNRDDECARLRGFESLAEERLQQMQALNTQLSQTSAALAHAELIVLEQQGIIASQNEVYSRFSEAEQLAVERLEHMQRLDSQLVETSAALARAERFVSEQQEAFEQRNELLAHSREIESLAVQRLERMQMLDAQLIDTSAALARAEQIVNERQQVYEYNDELLKRFRETEALAFERLEQMQKLDAQLALTSDALAHAERVVLQQQEALDQANLQILGSGDIKAPAPEPQRDTSILSPELK